MIPISNPTIFEEDANAVYEVIKNGWITMGKKLKN